MDAEACKLCGGEVVHLPLRIGQGPEFALYLSGLVCLGCASLDAIPRGRVPENRPGEDARVRRFVDRMQIAREVR
jgi:hypothetical protein